MRKCVSCLLIVSYLLVSVLLSGCQVIPLAAPAVSPTNNSEESFQWDLHCARMTYDGTVIEELECTFEGILKHADGEEDILHWKMTTPDDYPYTIPNIENYIGDISKTHFDSCPYFASSVYGYSKVDNVGKFCHFAVDFTNRYLIIRWDQTEEFLVCSADPDADLNAVFEHFEIFRTAEPNRQG